MKFGKFHLTIGDEEVKPGDYMTYPKEKGFDSIAAIPKAAAKHWVNTIIPEPFKGHDCWDNKIAIIVEVSRICITALYNHDGSFRVIRKML